MTNVTTGANPPAPGRASDLLVFAGAGASYGGPSSLPTFNPIRDELLRQIGLREHIPTQGFRQTDTQAIVQGLAPEPFLLALESTGAAVEDWLTQTLDVGTPNAVHTALGQLYQAGSKVWTVNFDRLIERSTMPALPAIAWPGEPVGRGILKPHGSLGGRLIFTAEDVLEPIGPGWRGRLEQDLNAVSHVVFIGYSARDLDMQPLWTSLTVGRHVLWFDFPPSISEFARRRAVVRDAASVTFLPQQGTPGAGSSAAGDPSVAFVRWCEGLGFVQVPSRLIAQLTARRAPVFPVLQADSEMARASVLSVLGDATGARGIYLRRVRTGPGRRAAGEAAVALALNHGVPVLPTVLRLGALLPPVGRLRRIAEVARRKRLTLLSVRGRHRQVLRATEHLADRDVSTLFTLRAASVRMTGSLSEAVDLARDALSRAMAEKHNVRIAHAAMQLCYALMWSGRFDEARACLDDELRPHAGLAAARWVAWADVLDASLLIHEGDARRALDILELAEHRFLGEGLVDGSISTLTVRLTAHRLAREPDAFWTTLQRLELMRSGRAGGRYYARGHRFSREAIALERAEIMAEVGNDVPGAVRLLRKVARSDYDIHACVAELYLARHATGPARSAHLVIAHQRSARIGAQAVLRAATSMAGGDNRPHFFP